MQKITLNIKQLEAIKNAVDLPFCVINGGAGTGKTTIIKEIYSQLESYGTIKLVAPTGKAAARLREASMLPTSTMHSMMRYNGEEFMMKNLYGHIIIIDESSMIDSWLLSSLINMNPDKIILIGDQAQLPPVGVGSPFHDIIKYKPEIVTTLDICYRSSEAIFSSAQKIRNFQYPATHEKSDNEEFIIANTGNAEKTEQKILSLVEKGVIDFEKDAILITRNGTEDQFCTRKSLNLKIAKVLNLYDDKKNSKFMVGSRVICTKNFATDDIWNGTTGTITAIDTDGNWYVKGDIQFCIDGQWCSETMFKKDHIKHCELAYALTVHKSQGSQYRNVIFACLAQDSYMMLYNSIIYTAITRAKKICYIVGDSNSFFDSVLKKREKNTILDLLAMDSKK